MHILVPLPVVLEACQVYRDETAPPGNTSSVLLPGAVALLQRPVRVFEHLIHAHLVEVEEQTIRAHMFQATNRVQAQFLQRTLDQHVEELFIPAKIEAEAEQAGKTI